MANQKDESQSSQRGGSQNFANDRERASEAGRKGGQHSHVGQQSQQSHGGSKDDARRSQQGGSSSERMQSGGAGNRSHGGSSPDK